MHYLLSLIALALPAYVVRFSILGLPTTLLELIIYAVFLYALGNMGYSQWCLLKTRAWLPIGFIFLGMLIGVYVAPDKMGALGQFKALLIDPLLVLWVMISYLDKKRIIYPLAGLVLSGLFVSVHTIVSRIIGQVEPDGRVVGIFGYSPNYTALYLAPIVVILFTYNLQLTTNNFRKHLIPFVVGCLLFVVGLVAIYFSGSRGGFLAIFAGVLAALVFHFWHKIKENKKLKWATIAGILLIIIGSWFLFRPDFSASGGRVTASNNVRWQIWETSLEMIKNQPLFGVGLGNYQNAFSELTRDRVNFPEYISPMAFSPHNLYLAFWLYAGILGLIGFIWLIYEFFTTGFHGLRKKMSPVLMAAMVSILAYGLIDTPYFKNDLALIFWLIFGSMLLLNKEEKLN